MKALLARDISVWHGIGWGVLYQITGDLEYAQRSAMVTHSILVGYRGRDERYAWATGLEPRGVRNPGSALRLGTTLAAVVRAYDLCYDVWKPELKKAVVEGVQQRLEQLAFTMAAAETANPHSNHYGAWNGGAGTAVLGILGDPGVDDARMRRYLGLFTRRVKRAYETGYGDHGWFTEGHHPSRIAANTGLTEFVEAYRNACGLDLAAGRPNVRWTALRWAMNLVPIDGKPRFPHRGPYGEDLFDQGGNSHDGDFSHGFGVVDAREQAALLWVYRNFVEPSSGALYNAGTYPHRAAEALINWPIDLEPINPAEVLPRAVRDRRKGYYMFRNRWQDGRDTLVTLLVNSEPARGCHDAKTPCLQIFGLGANLTLADEWIGAVETRYDPNEDGSGVVSFGIDNPAGGIEGYRASMAVDFSPVHGCEGGVIVLAETWKKHKTLDSRKAPGKPRGTPALSGGGSISEFTAAAAAPGFRMRVWTLASGKAPAVEVTGTGPATRVTIGGRAYRLDGHSLVMSGP